MTTQTYASTTISLKIDQKLRLVGGRWTNFEVGHAPEGGRTVCGGPKYETPFAYIFSCASVIYGGPSPYADAQEIREGSIVDIEGYGLHRVELHRDQANIRLVRLSDGFVS